MLVATDRNGVVQLANQRAIRVLKREHAAIVDSNWLESCVAPGRSRHRARGVSRLLMSGNDEPQVCEYHVRSSDGEDRFITWRGVALRDVDNVATGVMLSGEDITDQRRAESEAHRALERMNSVARLATMGEMAAGISHELNQPLAAIANYAQACVRFLRMPAPDLPEIAGALEQIAGQALRAGEIIRRIRSLVRNEDVRRETQDINELIREVHGLLASDARVHDGKLALDLASPLPSVTVDGVQIQQVLMNLVHNAFEAQAPEHDGAPFEVRIATRAAPTRATSKCRSATSDLASRAKPSRRSSNRSSPPRRRAPGLASRSAAPSSRRTTPASGIAPISREAHASTSSFRPIRRHRHERPAADRVRGR